MRRWVWIASFIVAAAWAEDGDYYFKAKVKDARDSTLVYFKFAADRFKIEGRGGLVLKARDLDANPRIYKDSVDSLGLEVKAKEESFKVFDLEGGLRWKVKFTEGKIKVSDNEENVDPYELKFKEGKVKVVYRGDELGSVKLYGDQVKVKDWEGRMQYSIRTPFISASYGLLLCGHIPQRERYVLMAEILEANY